MKVTYQREMKRNYMIIDPQDLAWEGYESRMVASNTVKGLLKIRIRQMENGVRFYYDITSKQPLSRILNGSKWKAEDFRNLLIQIFGTLERIDQYLLKESRIFLDPDFIYTDSESRKIWLCMIPGMERDFPEDLGRLLEKLLECADHCDRESVVLAYGIYQETRKENYGIEDLMRLIYKKPDLSGRSPNQEISSKKTANEELIPEPVVSGEADSKELLPGKSAHESAVSEESREGAWQRMTSRIRGLIAGKRERKAQEMMGREGRAEKDVLWKERIPGGEIEAQEMPQEWPVPEKTETGVSSDTIILAELKDCVHHRLLRALDAGVEDIPIAYYPFVIGKQENLVDYKLDDDTVSRLHVKIDRREERYLLQDLNSTNGTTLRGELLENNAIEEIRTGDEIGIARYRFRFE